MKSPVQPLLKQRVVASKQILGFWQRARQNKSTASIFHTTGKLLTASLKHEINRIYNIFPNRISHVISRKTDTILFVGS